MADNCQAREELNASEVKDAAKKCYILAIPAELRLSIYDFYFEYCKTTSKADSGSAIVGVCEVMRDEALSEFEKHLRSQLRALKTERDQVSTRYLKARVQHVYTQHVAPLEEVMKSGSERLDRIGQSQCAVANRLVKLEQMKERRSPEPEPDRQRKQEQEQVQQSSSDKESLRLLEEKVGARFQ